MKDFLGVRRDRLGVRVGEGRLELTEIMVIGECLGCSQVNIYIYMQPYDGMHFVMRCFTPSES